MSPFTPISYGDPDALYVSALSHNGLMTSHHGLRQAVPASGTSTANRIHFDPFHLSRPYSLARWLWLNGATVGTDYIEVGVYDQDFTLVKASPRVISAGTASQVQYQTPGIHGTNVTAGGDITDADTYTTASVTLKAGVLYLLAVENSHATDGVAVSSIDSATSGYPTFTSRSTTTYDSTNKRVSIWSAVPVSDWTGTLRIQFGASSGTTGCIWSLNAFYHVDTATTDGIVQNQVGTGTSVTPLATLSAYGSANNAGFAAFGAAANQTGAPTSSTTFELSDTGIATPVQALQCTYTYNDTTMDETITSAAWGACAVEIKSLGTGAVTLPPMRGYIAVWISGGTATMFQTAGASANQNFRPYGYEQSNALSGLPSIATNVAGGGTAFLAGFTSRSSP